MVGTARVKTLPVVADLVFSKRNISAEGQRCYGRRSTKFLPIHANSSSVEAALMVVQRLYC